VRVLALDFDGVICDSAREAFEVALRSYAELRPGSALGERERSALYDAFLELMPLGNRAEDYGTVLAALDEGCELPDQEAYDRFRAAQDPAWLKRYHGQFYEVRSALASGDPEGWRALMRPYEAFLDVLRRRAGAVTYAIATSKDRASVDALLDTYGVAELFPPQLIFDKETGEKKAAHLERLHERLRVAYPEMTFVDDKVNHLDSVAGLGARCALAAWGYNGPREHELARERGYLVCTLQDVEARLFDAAPRQDRP